MGRRAAVIVSGGGSISPFTTPDAACGSGLAAGSTDTALRAGLLAAGVETYTAPVAVGVSEATADPGWSGFAEPPFVLPSDMTINSIGDVEASAGCLARFLAHLHEEYDVDEVDLVAHSLGGVISRSAYMQMRESQHDVRILSLTSIGTPWLGSFVRHYDVEDMPMPEPAASYAHSLMGAMRHGQQLVAAAGTPPIWAAGKEHGLEGLRLARIAGTYFTGGGEPYPHDGMASRSSTWAVGADPIVFRLHTQCLGIWHVHLPPRSAVGFVADDCRSEPGSGAAHPQSRGTSHPQRPRLHHVLAVVQGDSAHAALGADVHLGDPG